jgi:hypothetical protein
MILKPKRQAQILDLRCKPLTSSGTRWWKWKTDVLDLSWFVEGYGWARHGRACCISWNMAPKQNEMTTECYEIFLYIDRC